MWNLIAPIVRWPLWSPWRLAAVSLVVIVVIVIVGRINGDPQAPAAETTTSAPTTASASPAAETDAALATASPSSSPSLASSGGTDAFSDDPADSSESAAAAQSAAAFVSAWARPDRKAKAWAAEVKPLVTAEAWKGLSTADPANTPRVAVSGQPVEVAINAEAGVFDVPTSDGGHVRVHLRLSEDGSWLVSSIEPIG